MHLKRRTKIVATIGPASNNPTTIDALVQAGLDVARLNASHGAQAEREQTCHWVREAAAKHSRSVAVLLDLQGPKIRTGPLADGKPVNLLVGAHVTITTRDVPTSGDTISTNYSALPRDVRAGDRILLADGKITLLAEDTGPDWVRCLVVTGGELAGRQGINLPGVAVSAPALTPKDTSDLEHGLRMGVDYVALSFVRRPEDVREARRQIRALGHRTPLVVKIEKPEAVQHLERILAIADGVMVARGDLGVEVPLEQVPAIQKRITRLARDNRVPVIVATQMLESMTTNERPTRAEASDVANAIFDSADAVMLSGETAVGLHPVLALETMARIASSAESAALSTPEDLALRRNRSEGIAHAAVIYARDIRARALVAITRTGFTARVLSSMRPTTPIIAITNNEEMRRQFALWWGVNALYVPFLENIDLTIERVAERLLVERLVEPGDSVVVVGGGPTLSRGGTSYLRLVDIPKPP